MNVWYSGNAWPYEVPPLPEARMQACYAVHGGRLWLLGGANAAWDDLTSVVTFDSATNAWSAAHEPLDYPIYAEGAEMAVVGDWLYGMAWHADTSDRKFFRYNVSTGVMEEPTQPDWLHVSNRMGLVAVDGLVYASLAGDTPSVYDPDTDSWDDALGTTPYGSDMLAASLLVDGGDVIVAGGGPWGSTPVRKYTPSTGAWEDLTSLPAGRSGGVFVLHDGLPTLIGGEGDPWSPRATVWQLNAGVWGSLPELPEPRCFHAGMVIGDEILIAGGYGDEDTNFVATSSVFYFAEFIPPDHPGDTLPRWWSSAQPLLYHVPGALPQALDGAATAYARGKFWVLGGVDESGTTHLDTVYSYDPNAREWTTETPLAIAGSSAMPATALGDWLYAELLDDLNRYFIRYNVETGATESLGHHDTAWRHPPVALDGLIYHALASPTPHVYDPNTGAWSALSTASPYTSDTYFGAGVAHQGTILLFGGTTDDVNLEVAAYRYSPNNDLWTPLPDLPKGLWRTGAAAYRGRAVIAGGFDADGASDSVYALNQASTAWTTLAPLPNPAGSTSVVAGGGRLLIAGGYGTASAQDDVMVYGQPPDDLEVLASTPLAFAPIEANLPILTNTTGGVAAFADLLLAHTTGREAYFDLPVTTDAPEASPTPPSVPAHEDSGDGLAVIPPGSGIPITPASLTACDQYNLTRNIGDGTTGSVTAYGRDSTPAPQEIPGVERIGDREHAWSRDAEIITTRAIDSGTRAALDTTRVPEFMPDTEAIEAIIDGRTPPTENDVEGGLGGITGGPDARVFALDAPLCSGVGLNLACMPGVRTGIRDVLARVRPTRLQVAQAAANAAGVILAVTPGVTTPGLDRFAPLSYSTGGQAASSVIRDMILNASAATWVEPGVMFIDGRTPPIGSLQDPDPSDGTAWHDGSADSVSINVTRNDDQPLDLEAPVEEHPDYRDPPDLEEYLDRCADRGGVPLPGGASGTFETDGNGTYAWTERSGGGFDYTEVDHSITKANGQVTREERLKRGWRQYPAAGGTATAFGPIERSVTIHTYLACCPQALAHSLETVHVARTFDQAPGVTNPGAASEEAVRWWNLMPEWYLHSRREVTQRWQAEGWLRARTEASRVFDGFEFSESTVNGSTLRTVRLTYNVSSRDEVNTPIGRGLWHRAITTIDTVLVPVREIRPDEEDPTTFISEIVGSNRSTSKNSYTEVTDASPPTVACDGIDCPEHDTEHDTCLEDQEHEWEEDYRAWEHETEVLDALRYTRPRRLLTQEFTWNEHLPGIRVGERVNTTRGVAVVARVTWTGASPRSGTPARVTTAEVQSVLP